MAVLVIDLASSLHPHVSQSLSPLLRFGFYRTTQLLYIHVTPCTYVYTYIMLIIQVTSMFHFTRTFLKFCSFIALINSSTLHQFLDAAVRVL